MSRLATNREIEIAQTSMSSLRHVVSNTTKGGSGADAQQQLSVLKNQLAATNSALDAVRGSVPYHVGARSIVEEFDRLQKTATTIISDLSKLAEYKGERRSMMSVAEKSRFISKNGAGAFESLPY